MDPWLQMNRPLCLPWETGFIHEVQSADVALPAVDEDIKTRSRLSLVCLLLLKLKFSRWKKMVRSMSMMRRLRGIS